MPQPASAEYLTLREEAGSRWSTLHPTPYTLHHTPYTLHPTPYTLHPTQHTIDGATASGHVAPCEYFSLCTLDLCLKFKREWDKTGTKTLQQ